MSEKKKFYAVVEGRIPGLYDKWSGIEGAEAQVKGYPKAQFKSFASPYEALQWLKESKIIDPVINTKTPIDKSFTPIKSDSTNTKLIEEKGIAEKNSTQKSVVIYTDGGCKNNPGPGGYGVVLIAGEKRKELSAGFRHTTNNRMELLACIEGLKALKYKCSVKLYSDSQYVVNGIQKGWAKRWRQNNWMRNKVNPAENYDLWSQLLDLCSEHQVEFCWVKGHAGNPGNERCDQLATEAATNETELQEDTAFVTGRTTNV